MKVASLWRQTDGGLELRPDLGRCEDPEPKRRILEFLGGGGVVLRSPGLREDRLDPTRQGVVPLGYRSDGAWIWPMELAYYLEQHGVMPEEELVEHMRSQDFVAPAPPQEVLAAASRLLTGG